MFFLQRCQVLWEKKSNQFDWYDRKKRFSNFGFEDYFWHDHFFQKDKKTTLDDARSGKLPRQLKNGLGMIQKTGLVMRIKWDRDPALNKNQSGQRC